MISSGRGVGTQWWVSYEKALKGVALHAELKCGPVECVFFAVVGRVADPRPTCPVPKPPKFAHYCVVIRKKASHSSPASTR